jgi:hypothetical protein
LRTTRARCIEKMIGLTNTEILEKNLVQFVIVVLPGMHQDVFTVFIQLGNHPRQANDFGTSPHDRDNFQLFHFNTLPESLASELFAPCIA